MLTSFLGWVFRTIQTAADAELNDDTTLREQLLEAVWGWTYGDTATVTVHVRRLREKIEDDPSAPRHLATVRGVGYKLV